MSGKTDLDKSKASAESESGPVDETVQECKAWVGIEAHYDDPWKTPITSAPVEIKVNGAVVASGPLNYSLNTFGREDGIPHDDVRDKLSQYRVNGVDPGSAEVALIPLGGGEADSVEEEIYTSLFVFDEQIRENLSGYLAEWEKDGWASVPASYTRGLSKGGKSWWEGEVDFWSSVGGAAQTAWASVKTGAEKLDAWLKPRDANEKVLNFIGGSGAVVTYRAIDGVLEWAADLWDRRDDIMALAKAFLENSIEAIEPALKKLADLPGELGKIIKDAVDNSVHWVQHMIEVARETPVFQRAFQIIMQAVMLMTPNFWAEIKGTVEGFIIPEVVMTVILSLIGAFCTAASGGTAGAGAAAALGARIASAVAKIRKAMMAAGKAGAVLKTFFTKIDDLFRLVGRLSSALRKKIDEAVEGATDAYNRIVRPSRLRVKKPKDMPCFTKPPKSTDKEFLRQLKEQEDAINNTDIATLQARRQAVIDAGGTKSIRNEKAQATQRKLWINKRAAELIQKDPTLSFKAAKAAAKSEASVLDATHILDIVAGGDPDAISGLADRSANRSLGSQWRTRVGDLDGALTEQAKAGVRKPNIKLKPC